MKKLKVLLVAMALATVPLVYGVPVGENNREHYPGPSKIN